jgi:BMFP domain-containing protein YqiC
MKAKAPFLQALMSKMQTQNPFLDEMAKLTTAAMGLAQAAGEEAKAALRSQADRVAAEFDLVRRDDLDALRAELAALRAEVAALRAQMAPPPDASGAGAP